MERFVDLLNALAKYHADVTGQQAAGRFDEAAQLSIEGKIDDAESRSADANRILGQARGVRRVWSSFIAQLTEMGIDDIPLAPLSKRLGQPIIISEATTVDPTTSQETLLPQAREERQLQPPTAVPEAAPVAPASAEPVPTFFAPSEPVRQVIEAARPAAVVEAEKPKRVDGDLGPREEDFAYALFAINEDRTGFANESLEDVVATVYKGALEGTPDEAERAKKLYRYTYGAEQILGGLENKLKAAGKNPDKVPHYLAEFIDWVKSQPEYADLSMEQMIGVVNNDVKFEDLRETSTPVVEPTVIPAVEATAPPVVETPPAEAALHVEPEVEVVPPVQIAVEPEVAAPVMGPEFPAEPVLPGPAQSELELTSSEDEEAVAGTEKRIRGDLTALEERVAYAFLAIDRENGGFQYNKRRDVVELIYEEQLNAIADPKERAKKISSLQGPIYQFTEKIMSKLRLASTRTDDVPHYTAELLKWINEQPEYANLSPDDLESVLFRRVTFDTLQQRAGVQPTVEVRPATPVSSNGSMPAAELVEVAPAPVPVVEITAEQPQIEPVVEVEEEVGPQLSLSEAYLLAQRLSGLDAEALTNLGIKLAPDDREEVEATIARLSTNPEASLDDPQAGMRLFKKLLAFAKDKQSIFMANEDEDVQYLLTLLAGVDSEDVIRELSGAPDVKKKTTLLAEQSRAEQSRAEQSR